MKTSAAPRLRREVFHTSRLLEFCGHKELVLRTGHEVKDWPFVIIKELLAITASTAPRNTA